MEIYKGDTSGIVEIGVPDDFIGGQATIRKGNDTAVVLFRRGAPPEDFNYSPFNSWYDATSDSVWTSPTAVTQVEPGIIPLPKKFVQYCGRLSVQLKWADESQGSPEDYQEHEVVQPLFTHQELVMFNSEFGTLSPASTASLERLVRKIIEAHTHQKFELTYETVIGRSHKPDSIVMPKRLISTAENHVNGVSAYLDSDGWIIRAAGVGQNDSRYDLFYKNHTWSGNMRVTGVFGYASVPTAVKTAALILAGDYGCDESSWRDQYVANLKNSDWRVEYNGRAWNGTGNVKADQLLSKYVHSQMVVI